MTWKKNINHSVNCTLNPGKLWNLSRQQNNKLGYIFKMFYPPLISKLGGKNQTYETQSESISTNQHDCDHDSIIICKISKAEYI